MKPLLFWLITLPVGVVIGTTIGLWGRFDPEAASVGFLMFATTAWFIVADIDVDISADEAKLIAKRVDMY